MVRDERSNLETLLMLPQLLMVSERPSLGSDPPLLGSTYSFINLFALHLSFLEPCGSGNLLIALYSDRGVRLMHEFSYVTTVAAPPRVAPSGGFVPDPRGAQERGDVQREARQLRRLDEP
jgi:hypothetical protein